MRGSGVLTIFLLLNSPFAKGIGRLVLMFYVGILWFLCSIPILTSGAATAALYEVLLKAVRDQEGYVGESFFRAFRGNLRQGIPVGILCLLAELVFAVNIFYYGVTGGIQLQTVLFVILFLLGLTFFAYVFAEMAKFENTVSGHFRMACVLMLRNPGWSAVILVVSVLELFLIYFFVYFPVLFIMGIGGYMKAAVFDHIFRKLIDDGRIVENR